MQLKGNVKGCYNPKNKIISIPNAHILFLQDIVETTIVCVNFLAY